MLFFIYMLLCCSNFVGWARALSESLERPRRIVMPDLRNHGDSPKV